MGASTKFARRALVTPRGAAASEEWQGGGEMPFWWWGRCGVWWTSRFLGSPAGSFPVASHNTETTHQGKPWRTLCLAPVSCLLCSNPSGLLAGSQPATCVPHTGPRAPPCQPFTRLLGRLPQSLLKCTPPSITLYHVRMLYLHHTTLSPWKLFNIWGTTFII